MKIRHSIKTHPFAWFLTFCFTLAVGIFPVLYKKLVDASHSSLLTLIVLFLYSILFCFLTSLPTLRKSLKNPIKINKRIAINFLILGILTVGGNIFFLFSIQSISPGIAQLIQRSEVVFVLYLCWIFFAEKISFRLNISVVVILIGMYFLKTQNDNIPALQNFVPLFWAAASGFCFALLQVMLQIIVRNHHPVLVNMIRFIITIVLLFLYPNSWILLQKITKEMLFWGFWAALIGPFFARLCYSYACKEMPVSTIVLITPIAPLITILFQWIFLGITISQSEIFGSIIILGGMYAAIKFR